MITFWIIAAVMLIAAILCATVPLIQGESAIGAPKARALTVSPYRRELAEADADLRTGALSQDQYASLRGDIEQRVLGDTAAAPSRARQSTPSAAARAATCALSVALFPSAACLLYLKLGQPAALKLDDSIGVSHDLSSFSVEMMVSRLAFRLRDHAPDSRDALDRATLARSSRVMRHCGQILPMLSAARTTAVSRGAHRRKLQPRSRLILLILKRLRWWHRRRFRRGATPARSAIGTGCSRRSRRIRPWPSRCARISTRR